MRHSRAVLAIALLFGSFSCGGGSGSSDTPTGALSTSGTDAAPGGGGPIDGSGSRPASSATTAPNPGGPPDANGVAAPQDDASSALVDPAAEAGPGQGADAAPIVAPTMADAATPDSSAARGDSSVNVANLPNVTLFLAGDSTVAPEAATSLLQGWGDHLAAFFINKVTVDNQALGGRSIQSFMYNDVANTVVAPHWQAIQNNVKSGDYVIIEFGINDSSPGSPRFVAVSEFTRLLGVMVDAIVAKRATPILVTPSALQYWMNGVETNAREQPYCDAMKLVAMQKNILVDDLNARSVEYLNMIGQTAAMQVYYNGDKAHFTLQGATQMAKIVTQELVRIGSPLGGYVK